MSQNLVVQLLLKTGTFSTDLKTAKGQVQSFQKGCQNAGDAVSAFSSALGVNLGSLAKFSGYAAAAAAAGKILKDSFKENREAMDAFNTATEQAKSTYKAFTSQLFNKSRMSIDFAGIADQAKEYYDAMDNAQNASFAITTQLQLQQVEYDKLYATATDVSLSEVDRLEALNEATKVLQRQYTLRRQMAQFEKIVAKERLENLLTGRGISKAWLESSEGQSMLKSLMQMNGNGTMAYENYYRSINTNDARTGGLFSGHQGIYQRYVEMLSNPFTARQVEAEALEKGYRNVTEFLNALRAQEEEATTVVNSMKYRLSEALFNLQSTNGEDLSKYITLYLNDMGLAIIDAERASADAMIERLRKRITGRDGSTPQYKEGMAGYVQEEIKKKQAQLMTALDQDTRDKLIIELDALQATLDAMLGRTRPVLEGTIPWLEQQIEDIENKLNDPSFNLGLPDTAPLLQKMNDWEKSWEEFIENLSEEELELFNQFRENMEERWNLINQKDVYSLAVSAARGNKSPSNNNTNNNDEPNYLAGSYGKKHQELEQQIEDAKKYLIETVGLSNEDIKAKLAELADLQQQLFQLEEQFGFRTTIEKTTNQWDEFNKAMANTSTIVNALTNTFKEGSEITAASVLQMVATCLPAIGSLISAISALTVTEAVEAGVGAVQKAVSTSQHWIEAIAAVASLGAVVAAAIAAASTPKMQKFASGGIVGGSSFTGDRIVAGVNSGEMILNRTQQANLFRMANGSGVQGNQVEFHISGTDLVGVLNNNNRKNRLVR